MLEPAEVLCMAWAETQPSLLGFWPLQKCGDGVVTDKLIDRLREEAGD